MPGAGGDPYLPGNPPVPADGPGDYLYNGVTYRGGIGGFTNPETGQGLDGTAPGGGGGPAASSYSDAAYPGQPGQWAADTITLTDAPYGIQIGWGRGGDAGPGYEIAPGGRGGDGASFARFYTP